MQFDQVRLVKNEVQNEVGENHVWKGHCLKSVGESLFKDKGSIQKGEGVNAFKRGGH